MAEITAKMVADLRAATGLGMMECKKALVAKDAGFVEFANLVAKTAAAKKPATVEELSALVEEERKAIIAKLGENMSVRRFKVIETPNKLVAYIHGALATEGVLVEFKGSDDAARKVGMQIVAANPQCLSEADVDAETV